MKCVAVSVSAGTLPSACAFFLCSFRSFLGINLYKNVATSCQIVSSARQTQRRQTNIARQNAKRGEKKGLFQKKRMTLGSAAGDKSYSFCLKTVRCHVSLMWASREPPKQWFSRITASTLTKTPHLLKQASIWLVSDSLCCWRGRTVVVSSALDRHRLDGRCRQGSSVTLNLVVCEPVCVKCWIYNRSF